MKEITARSIEKFYNWVSSFGIKFIIAMIVFFVGLWLINLIAGWIKKIMTHRQVNPTWRSFFLNLIKTVLQLLLVLMAMQLLGVKMTLFAAFIGALGVAAGLALSGTLQNFASGVLIILLKPFSPGDNIRTQGEEGTVTAIGLFYTTIVTYTNSTLIIPNGRLSNEVIFNLTLNENRRYDIVLRLKNTISFEKVSQQLTAAIGASKNVLLNPSLRIGVKEIQTDTYDMVISVWLTAHEFEDKKMLLNKVLLDELRTVQLAP